ncbi:hypothetical protein Pfo_020504 [Paulownia fortunei]|nr:hypothetical protein Pfo_020504 [Paulownia fortunei]
MSKEFAAEALKRADQITAQIPPASVVLTNLVDSAQKVVNEPADLEKFGITDELREFVKGVTTNTFRDFPLEDDSEVSDIPTVSNVRQDLTEWQERHAKLVLSTVKEISKLRYQLCPRVMKERKFWRIYFILVNSHVAPYEKRYMEDVKLKEAEKVKDTEVKEISSGVRSEKADEISKPRNNNVKSAASEQDLDVFLLGDLEDSDDGPVASVHRKMRKNDSPRHALNNVDASLRLAVKDFSRKGTNQDAGLEFSCCEKFSK